MSIRILLLDDNEELCEEMGDILIGEGYYVDMVQDAFEGLRLLEQNCYDILLLDLRLTQINGLNILRSIRYRFPKIKIFILSGYLVPENDNKYRLNLENKNINRIFKYADRVIQKPFNIEEILNEIKDSSGI